MKSLAVLAAALAISLACAGTASAQRFAGNSVSETQTTTDAFGNKRTHTRTRNSDGSISDSRSGTDAFGNKRTVTRSRNSDGSVSETRSATDASGNQRSVTRRNTDEGGLQCQTVTRRSKNALGDTASRTERRCAADF
jgi:hypothetical protein